MIRRISYAFVLLCVLAASAVGLQVPQRAQFAPSGASKVIGPKHDAKSSKPFQRLSNHIRLRPRAFAHVPVVKMMTHPTSRPSVVKSHATTLDKQSGTISFNVDLGNAVMKPMTALVERAPKGMTFSTVSWPALAQSVPDGFSIISSRKDGTPEFPTLTVTLAIPESASDLSATVTPVTTNSLGAVKFAPQLKRVNDSIEQRVFDASVYAKSWQFAATVSHPRTFRSMRTVIVQLPLVSSNGGLVTVLKQFKLALRFKFNGQVRSTSVKDPVFSSVNSHFVSNVWDVGRFSVPFGHAKATTATALAPSNTKASGGYGADSYGWIDRNAEYVKLTVTHDGLYRITPADLSTQPVKLAASAVRCFNRGKEIPIWVDSDANGNITGIEFYGEHLHGFQLPTAPSVFDETPAPEYYNIYTDKNIYWLTNSNSSHTTPKRFAARTPTKTGSTPIVSSGGIALHHERDYFYYYGDASNEEEKTKQQTEYVKGERFEWFELHGPKWGGANIGSSLFDTFYVSSLPTDAASRTARFTCHVRGMSTNDFLTLQHRAQFKLNGEVIADETFLNYDYDSLPTVVPLSKLHVGANIVELFSVGTPDSIDFFYLDYWECQYNDGLVPNADTTFARGQWRFTASSPAPVFQLGLVSSDVPHLYNLTEGARILDQSGALLDATNTQGIQYAATTVSSFLKPDSISSWNVGAGPGWSILNPSNQADYIVITHPDFKTQAGELATNRSNRLRSMVVTTEEIFNAFGYGSDEPEALRRFLSYAYYQYSQSTPVSLVTLLGDASWDPKMNMNNVLHPDGDRSNQRSFVPAYGWPVSDFYFTLVDSARDLATLEPGMVIARIPISTATEADAYITKLLEYENNPPAEWNRRWLFISGGDGGPQHDEFDSEIHHYLDSANGGIGMLFPPTDVDSTIIERHDFTQTDPTQIGAIEDAVRAGQSMMYFAGHGATFITDVILPDAGELHNDGQYPLLVTLSCRTGAFAEYNSVTLNESYLRAARGGSVQAYGTTGFGEVTYDDAFTIKLFQLMKSASFDSTADSLKPHFLNMAVLATAAKLFTSDSSYSFGFAGQNSRLQYSMLGDAATQYALKPQPEFAVHPNDIRVFAADSVPRTFFSVSDSVIIVSANVQNFGYYAGRPFIVRFVDAGPNNLTFIDTAILPALDDSGMVSARFRLTDLSVGQHTITVHIDPDHRFPQSDTLDDEAFVQIQVNGLSATPFYPYEGSRAFCDEDQSHARFVVLLPQGSNPTDQVELQLDTTQQFTTPILTRQSNAGTSYYVTFDVPIPATPIPFSRDYCWRTRIHRTTGEFSQWEDATFSTAAATKAEFSYSSPEQLFSTVVSGLAVDGSGSLVLPARDSVRYELISHGLADSGFFTKVPCLIFINERFRFSYTPAGYDLQGYVIAKLTNDGSDIDSVFTFDVNYTLGNDVSYTGPIADSFVSVIRGFPDSTRVVVMTNGQPAYGGITDNPKVTQALQSLGSKSGFTPLVTYGTYALMGKKGLTPGSAKEIIGPPAKNGTHLFDTIVTFGTSGSAETPSTAVARGYGNFKWTGPQPVGGSDIRFSILGSRRDGTGVDELDTLRASAASKLLDLSHIDPRKYDRLAIKAAFTRSSNATVSPSVSAMELEYDAAPEFAFTTDSLVITPRVTTEGGSVVANYAVRTLTCASADSVLIPILRVSSGKTDTVAYHLIKHIGGDTSVSYSDTIQTLNEQGIVTVTATVNPNEAQNEQLLFNNSIIGSYRVGRDTTAPYAEILLDDRPIPMCEYVSNLAHISINLLSQNHVRDTIQNSIIAEILPEDRPNDVVDVSVSQPNGYKVEFIPTATGKLQATLRVTPLTPWRPGRWDVTAFVRDASGNADTIHQCFTVSTNNGIDHVMNYPNPFKDKTDFTFVLRSDAPADVKVIVYTIAGRKIRTLTPTNLKAGLNWVEWDGRDEKGNDVGNGTYIYRTVINGKNPDGSDMADGVTQTAVRSR